MFNELTIGSIQMHMVRDEILTGELGVIKTPLHVCYIFEEDTRPNSHYMEPTPER